MNYILFLRKIFFLVRKYELSVFLCICLEFVYLWIQMLLKFEYLFVKRACEYVLKFIMLNIEETLSISLNSYLAY